VTAAATSDAFAHCEALVRTADRDRYLASLFAPPGRRGALCALYAFNLEIARVREVVREPLAGEIRLQWWSDALAGTAAGEVAANPVAAALLATVDRHRLPKERLAGLIEARRFDLHDAPMRGLDELESYADNTAGTLISLAAQVLVDADDPVIGPLALVAGRAQAIAGLLAAFARHAARGQLYVPLDLLQRHGADRADIAAGRSSPQLRAALADLRQRARGYLTQAAQLVGNAPATALPALLPAALARPMLDRMERRSFDPFAPEEFAPWRRQWRMWRAARRPARMFG
jgi:15-cis-phytoene synthase